MSSRSACACPGVRGAWDNRRARQHLARLCSGRSSPLSKGVTPVARMFTTLFLRQINSVSNRRAVCSAELLSEPQTKLCLLSPASPVLELLCIRVRSCPGAREDCPRIRTLIVLAMWELLPPRACLTPCPNTTSQAVSQGGSLRLKGAGQRAQRSPRGRAEGEKTHHTGLEGGNCPPHGLPPGSAQGFRPLDPGSRGMLSLLPSPRLVFWNPPSYPVPMLRSDSSLRWPELGATDIGHCPQRLGQLGCFCSLGANARPALFSVNLQLCPSPDAEIQARHSYLSVFLTCFT